ncbi:MAG: hypothetical protein ABFD59_08305 [Smithella sp.]
MAAGDMVQKGTTVVVGFNGLTYGTCIMLTASQEATGEEKVIKGSNNATVTILESDPGEQYTVEGILLSADLTAARSLKKGDTVSINSVNCRCVSRSIGVGTEEAKVTITAIKEASMTYT